MAVRVKSCMELGVVAPTLKPHPVDGTAQENKTGARRAVREGLYIRMPVF